MRGRDTAEEHRPATPLELFFDLCFVVAVAQAAERLHHSLAEGHIGEALAGYGLVFFAIWWAWMNFTWFASAYDTDDVAYRLAVLVQIAGVLTLAAGVPRAFDDRDFGVVTLGYVIMRVGLIALWLRAAREDPERRPCSLRYVTGVGSCQVGWITLVLLPEGWWLVGWALLVPAELSVPIWAERHVTTTWHPRHIAERYGLFTIIVLGESVLAGAVAIQTALDAGTATGAVILVALGGVVLVFAMWWVYFAAPAHELLDQARHTFRRSPRTAFVWGYGHFVVFASAAAVGAGLEVLVDAVTDHAEVSTGAALATIAVPVVTYVLSVRLLHARARRSSA